MFIIYNIYNGTDYILQQETVNITIKFIIISTYKFFDLELLL